MEYRSLRSRTLKKQLRQLPKHVGSGRLAQLQRDGMERDNPRSFVTHIGSNHDAINIVMLAQVQYLAYETHFDDYLGALKGGIGLKLASADADGERAIFAEAF